MPQFNLYLGDCLDKLKDLEDNSIDSIVTDPPYGLGFMGKKWDIGVPAVEVFEECLRVLKPGGHILAFGGSRTYHRLAVAVEDAGFEIRDQIMWVYGSGFPKSHDISKGLDKLDAADKRRARQLSFTAWMRETGLSSKDIDDITGTNMGGHYTTLASQPAVPTRVIFELIRPHLSCEVPDWVEELINERTVESENFKKREVTGNETKARSTSGNSALPTVGGDTVYKTWNLTAPATEAAKQWEGWGTALKPAHEPIVVARKPFKGTVAQNVLEHGTGGLNIDGCRVGDDQEPSGRFPANLIHDGSDEATAGMGNAAKYFYSPKASKKDRGEGNRHPTVKPTALMAYLCRLITPPGGVILDPFMGSGSTGKAAVQEGFDFVGIEMDPEYIGIAKARIEHASK